MTGNTTEMSQIVKLTEVFNLGPNTQTRNMINFELTKPHDGRHRGMFLYEPPVLVRGVIKVASVTVSKTPPP